MQTLLHTSFLFWYYTVFLNCPTLTNGFTVSTPAVNAAYRSAPVHRNTFDKNRWKTTVTTVLLAQMENPGNEANEHEEDDSFDVEAARRRLEALVSSSINEREEFRAPQNQGQSSPPSLMSFKGERKSAPHTRSEISSIFQWFLPMNDYMQVDDFLPPHPPMTSIERKRKEVEIELLTELQNGDQALTDLWDLWFYERGKDAADKLHYADELTGRGPQGWDEAEQILRELIDEHGVHWAEPVNRLATLYFIQGKLEQSETCCRTVLAVKPWHFGALSGLVMVYAGLHESESARDWAAKRLPTFAPVGPNRRRDQWVKNAVHQARDKLSQAEHELHNLFGEQDEYATDIQKRHEKLETQGDDCWQ
jgi:hypothetical protein